MNGIIGGYPVARWEAAKDEANTILSARAREGQMITYAELARAMRKIDFEPHDHVFHMMLGQVYEEEDADGRGLLSALVILQEEGVPGDGFWSCAAGCGRDISDRLKCWIDEVQTVFAKNMS
jgi:hypothetical protein